jgi:tetratricopeptide (TPR) repeat protein
MSGQVFISYRRDDEKYAAGRLYDHLSQHFPKNQIFIDVDNLEPGVDFIEAIEASVGSCDALIAVIGKRWLTSTDQEGKRRLDNPEDFVRLEIATALKRNIRVIPVLVDGALMPRSSDLPDNLQPLVRRNALDVSHNRFNADSGRLLAVLEKVLEKADAERKQREEKERLEAERLDKERLEGQQREEERLKTERREKDRVEAENREREQLVAERQKKERQEAESRRRAQAERQEAERVMADQREKERLEAVNPQRECEGKDGISNPPDESHPRNTHRQSARVDDVGRAVPPILKPSLSREGASSPRAKDFTIAPSRSQAQTKRLIVVALAVAVVTGITLIWLATHKERPFALIVPTPTPLSTFVPKAKWPDLGKTPITKNELLFNDPNLLTNLNVAATPTPVAAFVPKARWQDLAKTPITKNELLFNDPYLSTNLNVAATPTPATGGDAETAFSRGFANSEKKEYDKAIRDYDEAIRLNPDYAAAYHNRGLAYYYKNEYDKAIRDYNEAIRLNPNYADAYHNRGVAYKSKNDNDKAISDYTEAIRLNPNQVLAYRNRGYAYQDQGKIDKAKADFSKADELEKPGQ